MSTSTKESLPPLSGLRVLELAHVMAGPVCGRMLADLGADVVKLERPGGEDSRRMAPPWVGEESAAYLMINRNKRGIVVDLKSEKGKAIFRKLVETSDVVIENFRAGTLDRLGLGYEKMSALNPRLIWCEISGYGRTGPFSDKGGFDLIAQGMSGLMSLTGEGAGRPPVKVGVPVADICAGFLGALGVLSAVVSRNETGRGQRVDTSLFEAGIMLTFWQSAMALATGHAHPPLGSAHPLDAPYQAFEAADGWFNVGAANQANWLRLLKAIGREDLAADPRFIDNPARMENLESLIALLAPVFKERSKADWILELEAVGVPVGPILSVPEMLRHPQALYRDLIVETEHEKLGPQKSLGFPIKLSDTPAKIERGAPVLGQHTREVLTELGIEAREFDALVSDGVVEAYGGKPSTNRQQKTG